VDQDIKFVRHGSLKATFYAATSSYVFFTQGFQDVSEYNIFCGAKLIQLFHGVPLKKIGCDTKAARRSMKIPSNESGP